MLIVQHLKEVQKGFWKKNAIPFILIAVCNFDQANWYKVMGFYYWSWDSR